MPDCDALVGCPNPTVVQWQRRLTDAEMAAHLETHQMLRAWALHEADSEKPMPAFGPLPTAADTSRAVFACADHAIHLDLAALVHAADCRAPHPDHLPACDCQPDQAPPPDEPPPAVTLPTGWTVPAP